MMMMTSTGRSVLLSGWILRERRLKNKSFFDLKDHNGSVQLLLHHHNTHPYHLLKSIPTHSPVRVHAVVAQNNDLVVQAISLLNPVTAHLPFSSQFDSPNQQTRARFRYLDLRYSPTLSTNLKRRSQVSHSIRQFLHNNDFTEVETPILLNSSPQGAREFIVPTRSSLFYALSQSPQVPKQLLICSSAIHRYYQFARCFRDEDGRRDRQPEFTQLDLEIAFADWKPDRKFDAWAIGATQLRSLVESIIRRVWLQFEDIQLSPYFPVMTYKEAIATYGSDKPDTRFDLKILQLSDPNSNLITEALPIRALQDSQFIKASLECDPVQHPQTERLIVTPEISDRASFRQLDLKPGDHLWISSRPNKFNAGASTPLGRLRTHISEIAQSQKSFIPTAKPHFLWVTEFPLFTKEGEGEGGMTSTHHPFTAPMLEDVDAFWDERLENVRGQHYDLVLNGVEVAGGSVRIHDPNMQEFVFDRVLKLTEEEKSSFSQLIHALGCGAPPHAGLALGFDRLMSILCHTTSIKDVIAFPKSSHGTDLLFNSPSRIDDARLVQYGLTSLKNVK